MARKRRKTHWQAGELNLTAMIDLAFQLLSFFVITAKAPAEVTHLNVFRPQAEINKNKDDIKPPAMIRILVTANGFSINDRPVSSDALAALLRKLSNLDKNQTVLIMCESDSKQHMLVDVLDICSRMEMHNLSVMSATAGSGGRGI